jgi:transcriptional regulator with XRE-family HTH domain
MEDDKVAPLVARVSDVVAARLEEIAAETGVSYHTLYAWGRGRRNASAEHLLRLAAVVRRRAEMLQGLARELEAQADVSTRNGGRPRPPAHVDAEARPDMREPQNGLGSEQRAAPDYSRFP